MKHNYLKSAIVVIISLFANSIFAQLASYSFNGNLLDGSGANDLVFTGDPAFLNDGTDQVLQFDADDYAELPSAVHEAIDVQNGFGYHIRFKITETHKETPFEGETSIGKRVIISNKRHNARNKGFELYFGNWFHRYNFLVATYGDGTFSDGGVGSIQDRLMQGNANVGDWIDISVRFYLDEDRPRVDYVINGKVLTTYFNEEFNIEELKNSLSTQQIYVGTDATNNLYPFQGPFAEMNVDFLDVYSPIPSGSPVVMQNVLQTVIDKMQGEIVLTAEQESNLMASFATNWDSLTYHENKELVDSYLSTFDSTVGTVFKRSDLGLKDPSNFSLEKNIQFTIEQWMFDNLYTPDYILNMEGVKFKDHEVFPGPISSLAPRVSNASYTFDGDYQTDPGYKINNQEDVIRPTGYYAPPGELVTVTVPSTLINQGVKIRVGAHSVDLTRTWAVFNRFARVGKDFDITSTTVNLINPFGGGLYFILPDGSNYGPTTVTINGAVKTPYYRSKPGFENSRSDFLTEVANGYTEWVEFETENYMATFPNTGGFDFNNIDIVTDRWNNGIKAFNIVAGRPEKRIRSEYILSDRQNFSSFTVANAGNPMYFAHDYKNLHHVLKMIDTETFKKDGASQAIFHELGHLHNIPTLYIEQESNVHLHKIAAWNLFLGDSLVDVLSTYPEDERIKEKICHYQSLIPQNNAEYTELYDTFVAANSHKPGWIGSWEQRRKENVLGFYDELVADSINNRFDAILEKYFSEPQCGVITAEEELSKAGFKIHPNPNSTGRLNISGDLTNIDLEVYNSIGKLETIDEIHNNTIDVSNLSPGIYFVKLNNKVSQESYSYKFVRK